MKKIRKNVFETNSSSMHSLCMVGSDRMLKCEYGDVVTIRPGEFGWGGDGVDTPLEKLQYICTMIQYKDSEVYDDAKSVSESIYFKWVSEMFKDYTGSDLKYVPLGNTGSCYDDGYIDHQSTDTLDEKWSEDEVTFKNNMRDIVFNEKYFIAVDNDNH
jgi:hypothetical protein